MKSISNHFISFSEQKKRNMYLNALLIRLCLHSLGERQKKYLFTMTRQIIFSFSNSSMFTR